MKQKYINGCEVIPYEITKNSLGTSTCNLKFKGKAQTFVGESNAKLNKIVRRFLYNQCNRNNYDVLVTKNIRLTFEVNKLKEESDKLRKKLTNKQMQKELLESINF